MANLLKKLADIQYTPAIPYQPARPPYCYWNPEVSRGEWQLRQVGEWRRVGGQYVFVGTIEYVWVPASDSEGLICIPGTPAVPGSPARVNQSAVLGWNGGARSIFPMIGSGYYSFRVPAGAIGVVVGLSSRNDSTLPNEPSHAFYVHQGDIDILEYGQQVTTVPRAHDASKRFQIIRSGTEVTYRYDGWIYKSAIQAGGPQYLDASLYMTGDSVVDPVLGEQVDIGARTVCGVVDAWGREYGGIGYLRAVEQVGVRAEGYMNEDGDEVDLRRLRSRIGVASVVDLLQDGVLAGVVPVGANGRFRFAYVGAADDSLPVAYGDSSAFGVLPMFDGLASTYEGVYAQASGRLPLLSGEAQAGMPEISLSWAFGVLPLLSGSALGLTGQYAEGGGDLPMLGGLASNYEEQYSQALGYLPNLVGTGKMMLPSEDLPVVQQGLVMGSGFFPVMTIRDVIREGLELGFSTTATVFVRDFIFDALALDDGVSGVQVMQAIIRAGLGMGGDMEAQRRAAVQYAINALTGAPTTYHGFDFDGFASTQGESFGFRKDGVYRLGGQTDQGQGIAWSIDFGQDSFGSMQGKRVSALYLGLATDGAVFARLVADDGQELTYRVINTEGAMRAVTAKGVCGRRWNLVLSAEDCTLADLDMIEFMVGASSRRVLGGR